MLILFCLAALLFLVRFHVADEQRAWARHRIADVGNAVGLSLRAGLAFVALALVGSLVLTSFASSAPLSGWWHGLDQRLIDFGAQLARFFPSGGPGTSFGAVSFGPTVTIEGKWTSDDTPLISIRTEPGAPLLKWRMWAYDRLDANQWSETKTPVDPIPIPAGEAAPRGDRRAADAEGRNRGGELRRHRDRRRPGAARRAGYPQTVDQPAGITLVGGALVRRRARRRRPVVGATAAVPIVTEGVADALTANRLRAAGTDYPDGMKAIYTNLQAGTAGDDVKALLGTILDAAKPRTPYDTARAIEAYLSDTGERVPVPARRPRRRLRGPRSRRLLRRLEEGLLPALRDDDGRDAPPPGDPGPHGPGVPAGRARLVGRPDDHEGAGARLGRGVLPGLRLDRTSIPRRARASPRPSTRARSSPRRHPARAAQGARPGPPTGTPAASRPAPPPAARARRGRPASGPSS